MWRTVGVTRSLVVTAVGVIGAAWPQAATAQVVCGATIGPGTTVTLSSNLGPCSGVALVVNSAKLNLNGFTVTCASPAADDGIRLIGEGATLTNGAVAGCRVAVEFGGAGSHHGKEVTASGSDTGFLFTGPGNSFSDGLATGGGVGFALDSAANRVVNSAATGNGVGILVNGSNNVVGQNTVSAGQAVGIEIWGSSNLINKNQLAAGAPSTIAVWGEENNVGENVLTAPVDVGIEVYGSGNRIAKNDVKNAGSHGILIVGGIIVGTGSHVVSENKIANSGGSGILVEFPSDDNTLTKNVGTANQSTDFVDLNPNCGTNIWRENKGTANPASCIR